jgi:hypothetical protein
LAAQSRKRVQLKAKAKPQPPHPTPTSTLYKYPHPARLVPLLGSAAPSSGGIIQSQGSGSRQGARAPISSGAPCPLATPTDLGSGAAASHATARNLSIEQVAAPREIECLLILRARLRPGSCSYTLPAPALCQRPLKRWTLWLFLTPLIAALVRHRRQRTEIAGPASDGCHIYRPSATRAHFPPSLPSSSIDRWHFTPTTLQHHHNKVTIAPRAHKHPAPSQ